MVPAMQHALITDENAVLFFRQVKKDLGMDDTRKTVNLVSRILSHLRSGMNVQQLSQVINQLPGILQLLLADKWNANSEAKPVKHLDELVERVYEEDQAKGHSLLHSEVQTLNTIIVVLRRLDSFLNLFSFNILKYPLMEEVRQVPLEDAA